MEAWNARVVFMFFLWLNYYEFSTNTANFLNENEKKQIKNELKALN